MIQAPFVQKKLRKFAVTAGRSLRIQIPEETFFDMEDGNTRQLRVDIRQEDGTPLRIPWLKYDPTIQTIFALPFDENRIGRYTFKIVATDSQGSSTFDLLEIVVRQYSGARLVNHEFTVEFSFTNWRPETTKGWEWHVSASRCLKITEKVAFNIASEASYVYILSGQKLIKKAKNVNLASF